MELLVTSKTITRYSGKILGNSLSDLIVLSGTVFGEILVWSVDGDNSHILHRLTGHKVLFSLHSINNIFIVKVIFSFTVKLYQ